MPTVVRSNYSWRVYSGPNFPEASCVMIVYETFDDGSQSQREAIGYEKVKITAQVRKERAEAERTGNYTEHTISEQSRIYQRTSRATGNSWEVQLDAEGNDLPDPCFDSDYPDPRDLEVLLSAAKVVVKITPLAGGVRVFNLSVSGNLPAA